MRVAFQTAKVADGDEQGYVDRLRASSNYLLELALVAEEDGKIVGHIMLTRTYVSMAALKFDSLLLAPLCVALKYRNSGVSLRLVKEIFNIAQKSGFKAVFVVGDPAYYSRFVFRSSVLFGIKHVPPISDENVMVYELAAGALHGVSGTVTFTEQTR